MMKRTTAFGAYDHGTLGLLERVGLTIWRHPSSCIYRAIDSGRYAQSELFSQPALLERHFAFANNDLPGIMAASSARTYLNRYGVLPGKQYSDFH